MANITKRINKDGTTSYLIRAYIDENSSGNQITKSMTWRPPLTESGKQMTESAAYKQAEKEAVLFEEHVRNGIMSFDGKTKFADYAAQWMNAAQIAPKTYLRYTELLKRINKEIGHIRLDKLQAHHLEAFY